MCFYLKKMDLYTCWHYVLFSLPRTALVLRGPRKCSWHFGVLWNVVELSSYLAWWLERSASLYVWVVDLITRLPRQLFNLFSINNSSRYCQKTRLLCQENLARRWSKNSSSRCFLRTSYLVCGLERLLHEAGCCEASSSPWTEYQDHGLLADQIRQ